MAKDTVNKVKRQMTNWKKKFTTYIRDKKLPSLHYREPLKLERKKKTLHIEKVAKEKDSSQKRKRKREISMTMKRWSY